MRTHILLALTALIVTACASKREIASTHDNYNQDTPTQQAFLDNGASAKGNGNSIR